MRSQYWVLFFLSPFLSLIVALRNKRLEAIKFSGVLFITFIGLTMNVNEDADIGAYVGWFNEGAEIWQSQGLVGALENLILSVVEKTELLLPLLIFLLGWIGEYAWLLTGALGLITGLVMVHVFQEILTYAPNQRSTYIYLIIIAFIFLSSPVWTINGRFWLGFWGYTLIFLKYLKGGKLSTLLWMLLLPLVHIGWLVGAAITLAYHFLRGLPYRNVVFLALCVVAFVLKGTAAYFVLDVGNEIGGGAEYKADIYAKNAIQFQGQEDRSSDAPGFIQLRSDVVGYVPMLMCLFLAIRGKMRGSMQATHFSFLLLLCALAIYVSEVPSLGGRIQLVLGYLATLLLLIKSFYIKKISLTYIGLMGILTVNAYMALRIELVSTGVISYFGNPLIWIVGGQSDITFRDILLQIL